MRSAAAVCARPGDAGATGGQEGRPGPGVRASARAGGQAFVRSAIAGVPRPAWAAQVWAPAAAHGALGLAWLDLAWPGRTRLDGLLGLATASGALWGKPQATFRE